MGAVYAKELEQNSRHERDMKQPAGPDYQHDPLEGFANGRKRRGNNIGACIMVAINTN